LRVSNAATHEINSPSFSLLPMPTLIDGFVPFAQSDSRPGGSVRIGSGPVLPYQQLPRLPAKSSHQKSSPFGSVRPSGVTPILLPKKRLPCDVENDPELQPACSLPPAAGPQTSESGTANSIVPRRQLS
jgi:hypothetical protein